MLRTLVLLGALAAAVMALVNTVRMMREASPAPAFGARRSATTAPAWVQFGTGAFEEPAAVAFGADQGSGILRLTPTQLVFIGTSGRVMALERSDILGVGVTTQLPDRTLTVPVLSVTTGTTAAYFVVSAPADWERRLL